MGAGCRLNGLECQLRSTEDETSAFDSDDAAGGSGDPRGRRRPRGGESEPCVCRRRRRRGRGPVLLQLLSTGLLCAAACRVLSAGVLQLSGVWILPWVLLVSGSRFWF